ncbi:putative transcription factor bZIP family [Helianthus annuus]|nr:putative transcription factor bZIP family [Helianthus annuus]KAJ0946108.1 putative transcription factor bZIP family [Helianthus annuus]
MEHEKKKKQKKKKNKQGKTNASAGVGESTSQNNNHANVANPNHQNLNSDNSDVPKSVADSDRESISGTETSRSVEAEKSYWLNREASLEQKIRELQEQLDMHAQREVDLDRIISLSQKERNLWHHKEAELEAIISQLQTEKHSWLQKEMCFEEKRIQMEAKKVHLEEKESSATETIASMKKDNAKLQAQVIELETSIKNISHQNEQLKEHVSDLQSKIQDLENSVATHLSSERTKHATEYEDMNSRWESAQALVAKLLSENEKLVEKADALKTELDQKTATTQSSSLIKPDDPIVKNPKAADMDETSAPETGPIPSSTEKPDTVSNVGPLSGPKEGMPSDKLVYHMNSRGSDLNQISRVSMESGEIVQISLTENDATSATSVTENSDVVPLTDAPLIGAPFRLISFVARYVSGADLVQNSI